MKSDLFNLSKKDLSRNLQKIKGKSGFFSIGAVMYTENEGAYFTDAKKVEISIFNLWSPESPCPCRSGETFEQCCQPVMRIFTLNPDGEAYSPVAFFTEIWQPWNQYNKLKDALKKSERFFMNEDTPERCFWNYKGEKIIKTRGYPMVFGTVELTPDFLRIEGMSRTRYESLRKTIEQALDKTLPQGKLTVSLPAVPEDKDSIDNLPVENTAILEEYRQLREHQKKINSVAIEEILKDEFYQGAKDLKMLGPNNLLIFDDEYESNLLMDYCLFEIKRHGESIITHFMRKNHPKDEKDALNYQAFANSFVTIFQIEDVKPGILIIKDLKNPEKTYKMVDVNLSSSANRGLIIYTRLLPFPEFVMGAGWGFILDNADKQRVVEQYAQFINTVPRKKQVAEEILFFKKQSKSLNVSKTLF